MTAIELDRVEERTEEKKEPAKGWRNLWRCVRPDFYDDGRYRETGEDFWDLEVYPSKEIAEENAARDMQEEMEDFGRTDIYLGAFPVSAP